MQNMIAVTNHRQAHLRQAALEAHEQSRRWRSFVATTALLFVMVVIIVVSAGNQSTLPNNNKEHAESPLEDDETPTRDQEYLPSSKEKSSSKDADRVKISKLEYESSSSPKTTTPVVEVGEEEISPPDVTNVAKRTSGGVRGWFLSNLDPVSGFTNVTTSIFYRDLRPSRFVVQRTPETMRHPQITFIKGLKVGGTSVSVALDGAARAYQVKLQGGYDPVAARKGEISPTGASPNGKYCDHTASLFFHHAMKSQWMMNCMPHARFTTILREPISQTLSWESYIVNRKYFIKYPRRNCTETEIRQARNGRGSADQRLDYIEHCIANSARHNLTMQIISREIHGWPAKFPGEAVAMTERWLGEGRKFPSPTKFVETLKRKFFLVGVTERLNEFLILIALHMGWDPSKLYYRKCKPTDIDVTAADFKRRYPELHEKLRRPTESMRAAYEWARGEFADKVRRLNEMPEGGMERGWFDALRKKFETGLKLYQRSHLLEGRPFKWQVYHYKDGAWEAC